MMEDSEAAKARSAERALRNRAQAQKGSVVEGSGKAVEPRRLVQIISVRLDPELAGQLREVAQARGTTMSDLLRDGGRMLVDLHHTPQRPNPIIRAVTFYSPEVKKVDPQVMDQVATTA